MRKETFGQWLQKTSPSISGFNAMTVTELLYKFEKYIIENAVKGDTGLGISNITSNYIYDLNNNTIVTLTINYTNNTNDTVSFNVKGGLRGEPGLNGNGIKSVTFVESMIVGTQTVNRYNVNYDNGYSEKINIYVENGKEPTEVLITGTINNALLTYNDLFWGNLSISTPENISRINGHMIVTIKPVGLDENINLSLPININDNEYHFNSAVLTYIPPETPQTKSIGTYFCAFRVNTGLKQISYTIFDRYGNSLARDNVISIDITNVRAYAKIS